MNDALLVDVKGNIKRIVGDHLPLGIAAPTEFDDSMQLHQIDPGSELFIYTDGVNEAKNTLDEEFGEQRILDYLSSTRTGRIDTLVDAVHEFQGVNRQKDDISLVGIKCDALVHKDKRTHKPVNVAASYHAAECFPWQLQITLGTEDLKRTDTVQQAVAFLGTIQGVELHQDKLFTIFSELYNNALEHGVLRLDSSLKNSPDGFDQYYRLREQRLSDLDCESIDVTLQYIRGTPNRIKIEMTDTGDGFDFASVVKRIDCTDDAHGRGIHLLNSLCSELNYGNSGKTVTAYYDFN